MKIVEYKNHKIDGKLVTPEFIEFGNFFYNPSDRTYIGVIDEEASKDYYVPDTLQELTKEELIQRQIVINDGSENDVERWYTQFILKLKPE